MPLPSSGSGICSSSLKIVVTLKTLTPMELCPLLCSRVFWFRELLKRGSCWESKARRQGGIRELRRQTFMHVDSVHTLHQLFCPCILGSDLGGFDHPTGVFLSVRFDRPNGGGVFLIQLHWVLIVAALRLLLQLSGVKCATAIFYFGFSILLVLIHFFTGCTWTNCSIFFFAILPTQGAIARI